jgi:hypothetical protein
LQNINTAPGLISDISDGLVSDISDSIVSDISDSLVSDISDISDRLNQRHVHVIMTNLFVYLFFHLLYLRRPMAKRKLDETTQDAEAT